MLFSVQAETLLRELGIPSVMLTSRGLREQLEAKELEIAEIGPGGRQHLLEPTAAEAWRLLKRSASEDGVSLFVVSAFRSIERQSEIVKRKFASGESISKILAVSAPPCFSEHHTGRAVDIGTPSCKPLEVEFKDTEAFRWLQQHAGRFGFVMSYPEGNDSGYQYEPWHWCHQ
ncbi:D-alanyl-D-alanine carboxypeptidase family protein [uncultured Desulfosarcina sp.]|uniref:M15 family metallopeptidase n=1 Tax=uncultured Desulfosarcina sp. TaxID=218289 RepID=UPI0029C95357|nr:D-alanyl-D-alanine carboxypeptidase family protein [uncultured Desulfosarcina sp.]